MGERYACDRHDQLNEKSEFRGATANLHVVERFRRVSADMILYQFTVEDPATWPNRGLSNFRCARCRNPSMSLPVMRQTTDWPTFSRALGLSNVSQMRSNVRGGTRATE